MRLAYLDEEWNRPSRMDHYLMVIVYTIANLFNKKAKQFRSKDYTLTFGGTRSKKKKPMTEAEQKAAVRQSKSRWFGMLGIGRKV